MSDYSEYCVYTIKHSKDLGFAFKNRQEVTFHEQTNWKTGFELLRRAQGRNLTMPIVFAEAESTDALVYWGKITDIRIHPTEKGFKTDYTFRGLAKLKGKHSKTELILKSKGRGISENYIRPYAICYTPEFLK